MTTLFEQLRPFKWRDVGFPVTAMRVSLSQDMAQHKFYGRDAANVEATGRDSLIINATIPFRNGVTPGKGELWSALYPTAFRAFLVAMADSRRGVLQHPELGDVQCKPHTCEVHWDANKRDGCDVEASWIETVEDDDPSVQLSADSPVAEVTNAAQDLTAQFTNLKNLVPTLPVYTPGIADFLNGVAAIGDQVSLLKNRASGSIASLMYRLQTVQDSIERAMTPLTWPAIDAIERVRAAANDFNRTVLAAARPIATFTVPVATTMAGLSVMLPDANVGDLIKLNPSLMAGPVVPAGTVIRYYVPRRA